MACLNSVLPCLQAALPDDIPGGCCAAHASTALVQPAIQQHAAPVLARAAALPSESTAQQLAARAQAVATAGLYDPLATRGAQFGSNGRPQRKHQLPPAYRDGSFVLLGDNAAAASSITRHKKAMAHHADSALPPVSARLSLPSSLPSLPAAAPVYSQPASQETAAALSLPSSRPSSPTAAPAQSPPPAAVTHGTQASPTAAVSHSPPSPRLRAASAGRQPPEPHPPRAGNAEDVLLLRQLIPDSPAPLPKLQWWDERAREWNAHIDALLATGQDTTLRRTSGKFLKEFDLAVRHRAAQHETLHPASLAEQAAVRAAQHAEQEGAHHGQHAEQEAAAGAASAGAAAGEQPTAAPNAVASGSGGHGSAEDADGGGRGGKGKHKLCRACRCVLMFLGSPWALVMFLFSSPRTQNCSFVWELRGRSWGAAADGRVHLFFPCC